MESTEMKDKFETLGDACKAGEEVETLRHATAKQVIMVRLDGHGFSRFTKGLNRPYDERMSKLMADTLKFVVEHTGAVIASTQSDEQTLVFIADENGGHWFGGRFQKIATTCAAMATSFFNKHLAERIPEKVDKYPTFDGRAWSVENIIDAYNNLLWRERDAIKNSITMAASLVIPHKLLQGVNGTDKKTMLLAKGIDWNDYPDFFKRGIYVKRLTVMKHLDLVELARIPEDKRPTGPIERSIVVQLDLPEIHNLNNYGEQLFKKKLCTEIELRNGTIHVIYQ